MYESNINNFQSLYGIYRAWFVGVWSTGRLRVSFFPLARYPRANSPVGWPPRECICVCWQVKENVTELECVTMICCAFCHAMSWLAVVTDFLVENNKVGITFPLEMLSAEYCVTVVLRTYTVVCCFWTFKTCLAFLHCFGVSNRKSIRGSSPAVLNRKSCTTHKQNRSLIQAFDVRFGDAFKNLW